MTKKRQQDFAKVRIKPGRLLNKGKNTTSTTFKSKKIVIPKEKTVKGKAEFTIKDCIQKIKSAYSEKDKIVHLNELCKLIPRQLDTINIYLSQIFDTVLNYIRDPYDGVRNAALKAIISVLVNTDDLQLHSYSDLLNNNISAIMKNPNQKIAPASLTLLDCMLKNHPDLICHNISIMFDLLPTERKHYTRKINTEREAYQYCERGEINALGHINAFIKNMLKIKSEGAKNEDTDKDVYMDCNEPLYLEIYAGGGLQPVDIEEAYSRQFGHHTDPFEEVGKLTTLIGTLLHLIPSYFCQIIGSEANADDNAFRSDPIAELSILIQLLCNVAELMEKIPCSDPQYISETKDEIALFLKEKVFLPNKERFPFELHTVISTTSLLPLALLNNSLCFLYMKFLSSNDDYENDMKLLEKYLSRFFTAERSYSSETKCRCIPLFVKMVELYYNMTDVPKVIYYILAQFVALLKTRVNHPNKKMLIDLLFNMSLLPGYKFWVDSEPMELWYEWLLSHLKENISKLDKKLIRIILKIAKLKHSSFVKHLDFSVIRPLLKHRNDDLKEAAIFLLHNMNIDHELLKNVYDIIIMDSFPRKFTIKLIRMVHARFTQYPEDEKPYVDYIEFLINIAIDTHNFYNSKMLDFDANQYTKAIESLQLSNHTYVIFPSLHWKEHSKIFEVCLKSLRNLPLQPVSFILGKLFKELVPRPVPIPLHCALSILKLGSLKITDKYYRSLMRDLNFSCLITTSVLTQMPMDDEWYKWNVSELVNNVVLTEELVVHALELLEQGQYGKFGGLAVYHILRVMKVFIERHIINRKRPDALAFMLQVLTNLVGEHCYDNTIELQPLYKQLYSFFVEQYQKTQGRR